MELNVNVNVDVGKTFSKNFLRWMHQVWNPDFLSILSFFSQQVNFDVFQFLFIRSWLNLKLIAIFYFYFSKCFFSVSVSENYLFSSSISLTDLSLRISTVEIRKERDRGTVRQTEIEKGEKKQKDRQTNEISMWLLDYFFRSQGEGEELRRLQQKREKIWSNHFQDESAQKNAKKISFISFEKASS